MVPLYRWVHHSVHVSGGPAHRKSADMHFMCILLHSALWASTRPEVQEVQPECAQVHLRMHLWKMGSDAPDAFKEKRTSAAFPPASAR